MKNLKYTAVAAVAAAIMTVAPVAAADTGQLQGGTETFQVRNITTNGEYANALSGVACGDTIRFSTQLANTGFMQLDGLNVKATLGNTTSMTATTTTAGATGTSGSVTVALTAGQKLAYNAGSTRIVDGGNSTTPADGNNIVTPTGVNAGNLDGSAQKFVNFDATVKCDTPTTPETPVTPEAPTELPETGAGAPLAGLFGAGAMGVAAMLYNRSRKAVKRS